MHVNTKFTAGGGPDIFRSPFSITDQGVKNFQTCGQGEGKKNVHPLEGGQVLGVFFASPMTNIFPKGAQKHQFCMFRGL